MAVEPGGILILGATGQVGLELRRIWAGKDGVTALTRAEADLAQPDSLRMVVARYHPDVIVNAAAYTAVDRAESEPELAHRINGEAPGVLAEEAERLGAMLVHYSTDYVFDGRGGESYREDHPTNPLSVYGASKLAGEQAVLRGCRRHVILRSCWVMAAHGANFLRTMLRLAGERDQLRVVSDQHGVPTPARLIARVTAQVVQLMAAANADDPRWTVYHLAAGGETTWFDYARYLLARAKESGWSLRAGPAEVEPIATADFPTAARRPANSRLCTDRLRSVFGVQLPDWKEGVNEVLAELTLRQPT